ncbi:MAG: NADH-quinone oxidoreductase subunit C [Firmicutes bacterium]|jgi:ech hydrogenase subunit D|nr:NADH-quinone oxidoreductase subunit C [Bacillota bacterium]
MSEQEKKAQEGEEKEPLMDIKEIEKDTLLDEVTRISFDNWRLIQICATKVGEEKYEILYTFGKGYQWKNLRIHLSRGESVSSITSIYEVAYLYENEIHDLYGIGIDMLNYDFGGKLFRTGVQYPFA